jgi:hypothetical protein
MAEPRVSLIPGISELLADKGYDTATRSANSLRPRDQARHPWQIES